MITATYFGEITELDSRAVWYSDEEDEDDEDADGHDVVMKESTSCKPVGTVSHDSFRASVQDAFNSIPQETSETYSICIISLSSQFKNFKFSHTSVMKPLCCLGNSGRAISMSLPINQKSDCPSNSQMNLLWLMFDSSSSQIVGHEVGYFAESLLNAIETKFRITKESHLTILSQQFSTSNHLEYLSNYEHPSLKVPFVGKPISPPHLIKNQFESALFEQSTLLLRPAMIACLPDPKSFWFNRMENWPTIPSEIIDQRLKDDNLEKTLIFT